MPSFLSKVFGRKKDDKESSPHSASNGVDSELLEGKFEAVSPSATKFPEVANGRGAGPSSKEKEKETGFTLFRSKSPASASHNTSEKSSNVPHLSLNLPGPKDDSASARALGVVFEADPATQLLLSDAAIGSRRLSPLETLILVRACSQAIKARGLETLGIMHPHWHSASPDVQKRLISLFILSLDPKSPRTTLSPSPSSLVSAFESEISSTRSPYDVAAVLRWGIRHLQLEGSSFGKEDSWYKNFFESERSSDYPPNAYSKILGPSLPASHFELLTVTLEIFMSLAAHAEVNGISGSKLAKFLGLWLLTLQRAQENDHWSEFYTRWERTGRMLEHLFLARIRDEAIGSGMPRRLLELVRNYPYGAATHDTDLLPYLRFSTRRYDALFVRIETELADTVERPARHPLRLISEALKAETTTTSEEHASLWETIRKAGTDDGSASPGSSSGLGRILADETIRFFALLPVGNGDKGPVSPFSLHIEPMRKRSFSLGEKDATSTTDTDATKHSPRSNANASSAIGTDWMTFSTSGFFEGEAEKIPLATTLLDKQKDMEVTVSKVSAPRTKPLVAALVNGRKSLDTPRTHRKVDTAILEEDRPVSKTTRVSLIQLDEAFVDFWSDALLDPISLNWPAFIICKLKPTLSDMETDGRRIEWLVIEQAFKRPQPTTPISPETATSPDSATSRPRPSSPKSEISFSSARKRFSFFTSSRSFASSEKGNTKRKTKVGKSPRVGEMGEVLAEEEENKEQEQEQEKGKAGSGIVKVRIPSPKPKKSVDVSRKSVDLAKKSHEGESRTAGIAATGLAAGAAAAGGAGVVAATSDEAKPDVALGSHTTNGAVTEPVSTVAEAEAPSGPQDPLSTLSPDGTAPQVALVQQVEKAPTNGHVDLGTSLPTDLEGVPTERSHALDDSAVAPLDTIESSPTTQPTSVASEQAEVSQTINQTEPEPHAASTSPVAEPTLIVPASAETVESPSVHSKHENNGTIFASESTEEKPSESEIQPLPHDAQASEAADDESVIKPGSAPGTEETTLPTISEVSEASSVPPEPTITAPSEESKLDAPADPTHSETTPEVDAKEPVPETEVTDLATANGEAADASSPDQSVQVEHKDAEPSSIPGSAVALAEEPSVAQAALESAAADVGEESSSSPSFPITEPVPQSAASEHENTYPTPIPDTVVAETSPADDEEPSASDEAAQPTNEAAIGTDEIHPTSEPETLPVNAEPPTLAAEPENTIPLTPESEVSPAAEAPHTAAGTGDNEADAVPPIVEAEALPTAQEPPTELRDNEVPADDENEIQATSGDIEPQPAAVQELTPEADPEMDQTNAHSEPLKIPEEDNADTGVTLPDVPIVEVEPTLPAKEDASIVEKLDTPAVDAAEAETAQTSEVVPDEAVGTEEASAVQAVVAAGSTPGPQTILDAVVDSTVAPSTQSDTTPESSPPKEESEAVDASRTGAADDEPTMPSTEIHATETHDDKVAHSAEELLSTVEKTEEQTSETASNQPAAHDDTDPTPSPDQEQV